MFKKIGEIASANVPGMILDFCWDAIKSIASAKLDANKLKEELDSYLSRKLQENQICTLEEELDLEGLIDYINRDFMGEVKLLLLGSPDQRTKAKQEIRNHTRLYANAKTKMAADRAEKIISDILRLLNEFYRAHISESEKLLAAEIEDSINAHTSSVSSEAVETLSKVMESGFDTLNNNIQQIKSTAVTSESHSDTSSLKNNSQPHKWFRSDTGEEVRPDQLIMHGNVTAQLDGNITRSEIILPDGKSMYSEFNIEKQEISNIKLEGFPQEYSIRISDDLIITSEEHPIEINGAIYFLKYHKLKFGGYSIAIYDLSQTTLIDIQIHAPAGMKVHVDINTKQICFVRTEDTYM